jgi:phospholipid/cholesterol/gamma-HCH transport system permease protein
MEENLNSCSWWYVKRSSNNVTFVPRGSWRLAQIPRIRACAANSQDVLGAHNPLNAPPEHCTITIDGSELTDLDTAGAALLFTLATSGLEERHRELRLKNFTTTHAGIAHLVHQRWIPSAHIPEPREAHMTERIGHYTVSLLKELRSFTSFIGEFLTVALATLSRPKIFRKKEFIVQLELVCIDAIPIITLVSSLIGVVIAYLFAMQLMKYGATIFIVDGVVLAMTRELAPIIVAITLAGRSGSAFTAHLGTMKINEEIDAMTTMGLAPMRVLVIPRVLALTIATPLLTFLGALVGIIGGLAISYWYVDITPSTFFDRIQINFPYKSFYLGLAKAPVFAAIIAMIGCYRGLTVENNARSVGLNTTSTVVQSIVAVIILDALFAVIFAHVAFY